MRTEKYHKYQEEKVQRKRRRLYNIEHSLCLQCSQPSIKGQRLCKVCRDKAREQSKSQKGRINRIRASQRHYQYHSEKFRNYIYMKLYGINLEKYNQMLELQNGVCAICDKPPTPRKRLSIDHNHINNKVRGLLCLRCNLAIDMVEKTPQMLKKLSMYLRKHEGGF